jgi:hypothetical protein
VKRPLHGGALHVRATNSNTYAQNITPRPPVLHVGNA